MKKATNAFSGLTREESQQENHGFSINISQSLPPNPVLVIINNF
jgi:hypothetical protein